MRFFFHLFFLLFCGLGLGGCVSGISLNGSDLAGLPGAPGESVQSSGSQGTGTYLRSSSYSVYMQQVPYVYPEHSISSSGGSFRVSDPYMELGMDRVNRAVGNIE